MTTERPILVPELYVSDLATSLSFYLDVLGFTITYARTKEGFASIEREGAWILLEQTPAFTTATDDEFAAGQWRTADLTKPFGRGINFEIQVSSLSEFAAGVQKQGYPMRLAPHRKSHATPAGSINVLRCLVEDPDGYILRFYELVAPDAS